MSERTSNIEQVIDHAKTIELPTRYAIFLFLLHNRTWFSGSDLQAFAQFDKAAWKVVNAKRPRPRCACHLNPPPPAPHDVESSLERARSMYYILDVKQIEALLNRHPDCTKVVERFLCEAEALVALESFKDAIINGPTIAASMEMTRVGWHELIGTLPSAF